MNVVISLNGTWQFCSKKDKQWKNGRVPGCVQMDLMALGELGDPFYRLNEIDFHKLEEEEWIYRKEFEWNDALPVSGRVYLVFEGIDTLADVYMNGYYLGRAENMFIPYRFDVGEILRSGLNEVEVHFDSPIRTIRAMERNSPVTLRGANNEIGRPYVRKAQYSYGWDWGPRIAQVGLWRPVYLEVVETAKIRYPFFETRRINKDGAFVATGAEIEMVAGDDGKTVLHDEMEAFVEIFYQGKVVVSEKASIDRFRGKLQLSWEGLIENAALWYPNGMGQQPLYEVKLRLVHNGKTVDEHSFRTGIRTVRLIRERDEVGESFIFEINGEKVFAKGANWIPADSLLPRLTEDDYYYYIKAAKDANMNMLRIWGGGIYEHPAFYEACDRMGIMVWQDFMYACAQYPDQFDWFQRLAETEAEHVVKSLRIHPSIVLWCGNNENNWGFHSWWGNGVPKYLGNYIYQEILPRVCAENDPSRPYWVSSPYGGEDPNSMAEGDRHCWTVWSGWADYNEYLNDTGRFISEFGFQAMPCLKTIYSFTQPEDRHPLSPVMLSHNKMVDGTERLVRFMIAKAGFPKDFSSFVYLTQFIQAEAIKTGVEHWRTRKFNTAGTLYWQLNDCWPVASWSCIDYHRRKKGLYYYTKNFFHNILIVPKYKEGRIFIHAVNDTLDELDARVRVTAYALDGTKKGEIYMKAILLPNSASVIGSIQPEELGIGYRPVVMPVDADPTVLPVEKNGELLDTVLFVELVADGQSVRNYLVFDAFRNLELKEPNISCVVKGNKIELVSDKPAFGVFIETQRDVELSDNCLVLEPSIPHVVEASEEPGDVKTVDITRMVIKLY